MDVNITNNTGASETDGRGLLENLCSRGFDGNVRETAMVLGRNTEELEDMLNGSEPPDEDLVMKIRGVAQERGIAIE